MFRSKISTKSFEPFLRYGQKTSKMNQKWGFSPVCDPQRFFFKNQALSLLYPYGALTSCKTLEKTNGQSLKIFKDKPQRTKDVRITDVQTTDRRTTDGWTTGRRTTDGLTTDGRTTDRRTDHGWTRVITKDPFR